MKYLCAWREKAIAAGSAQIAKAPAGSRLALIWYTSLDVKSEREPICWRPHCSAVAELAARHGAQLVTFHGTAYVAWLGQRKDTEAMRSTGRPASVKLYLLISKNLLVPIGGFKSEVQRRYDASVAAS